MEAGPRVRRGPGLLAQTRGTAGEKAAVRFLERAGYRILDRNFRIRTGEVDIVARDGGITVFVEVKRRESPGHGSAAEFVTGSKIRRVVSAARAWAARHGVTESPIRFDVIGIDVLEGEEHIHHYKGAFDAR